jgi:hypothetical protein
MKINIYVACVTQHGYIHNSSPCIDCVAHFNKLFHTIKYLVYTNNDEKHSTDYSMNKIHFRDYNPTLLTSGRLFIQKMLNNG